MDNNIITGELTLDKLMKFEGLLERAAYLTQELINASKKQRKQSKQLLEESVLPLLGSNLCDYIDEYDSIANLNHLSFLSDLTGRVNSMDYSGANKIALDFLTKFKRESRKYFSYKGNQKTL